MMERSVLLKFNEVDLLGNKTPFRSICEAVIGKCLEAGKWFSVCKKIDDKQFDIMSLTAPKSEKKLGSVIAETFPDMNYRSAIYKYLLCDYLCYVEIPKWGRNGATFDKYLCTSNLNIASMWVGEDVSEKYSDYIDGCDESSDDELTPYLKLTEGTKGERKITKPRKPLDIGTQGMRVIPLFMLERGVDYLYEQGNEDFIKVNFMKDAGIIREMVTSFNIGKIEEVYGDCEYVRDNTGAMYGGNFIENKTLGRGYIRVFEVGSSRYDSPLRSINYARIIDFEVGVKPDTLFVDLDIESARTVFVQGAISVGLRAGELWNDLKGLGMDKYKVVGSSNMQTADDLINWVDGSTMVYSTVFKKDLTLAMLALPQWFNNWAGEEVIS